MMLSALRNVVSLAPAASMARVQQIGSESFWLTTTACGV